jgi:hypothetical protein
VAPRSYIVRAPGGEELRRNRKDLLKTDEHPLPMRYDGECDQKGINAAMEARPPPLLEHEVPVEHEMPVDPLPRVPSPERQLEPVLRRSGRVALKPERLIETMS